MKTKIRYLGYSSDLSHPADRRRIVTLTKDKNYELVDSTASNYDVTILTLNAQLDKFFTQNEKKPILIELVDGYLADKGRLVKGIVRNMLHNSFSFSSLRDITYTRYLQRILHKADGVIVSSEEIKSQVKRFNKNTFVILDNHSELKPIEYELKSTGILWEGFGSNLKHLLKISSELDEFLHCNEINLHLVTQKSFRKYANRFFKVNTFDLIEDCFPKSANRVFIHEWTIENLRKAAEECRIAIIPISQDDPFALSKCENKLLSMWTLGLPTITSFTPSYSRVMTLSGQPQSIVNEMDWGVRLRTLWENQELLVDMRNRGQRYVGQTHVEHILLDKWREVLEFSIKTR